MPKISSIGDGEAPTQVKNQDLVKERRRQIVEAALPLFIKNGFHKTAARQIAKAASVSVGSMYEYINSKEDILRIIDPKSSNLKKRTIKMVLIKTPEKRKLSPDEINRLIQKTKNHAHGIDFFLQRGLECVAIMFDTDVFTVEAARKFYRGGREE